MLCVWTLKLLKTAFRYLNWPVVSIASLVKWFFAQTNAVLFLEDGIRWRLGGEQNVMPSVSVFCDAECRVDWSSRCCPQTVLSVVLLIYFHQYVLVWCHSPNNYTFYDISIVTAMLLITTLWRIQVASCRPLHGVMAFKFYCCFMVHCWLRSHRAVCVCIWAFLSLLWHDRSKCVCQVIVSVIIVWSTRLTTETWQPVISALSSYVDRCHVLTDYKRHQDARRGGIW